MAGKCPKCDQFLNRMVIHTIDAVVPQGATWKGVTYACPMCSAILGAGIDPVALKNDTVAEVIKKLKR